MRRRSTVFLSLTLVCCLGFFVRNRNAEQQDPMVEMMQRKPSKEEIVQSVREAKPNKPTETIDNAKRRVFAEMVKQRYRKGEPSIAVGLRFTSPKRVRFFVPARMDPWEIDRIIYALWYEGVSALDTELEIDVCETFIGMAPVKIGELRHITGTKEKLNVVYTYSKQHYAKTILP